MRCACEEKLWGGGSGAAWSGELVSAGVIYGKAELDIQVRGRIARTAARHARILGRHEAAVDAAWTEGGIGGLDESLLQELATARV